MKSTPGKKKLQVWLPLLFSIVMVIGMVFGYKLRDNTNTARNLFDFKQKRSPLQEVFDLVTLKYVDTVNTDTLGNDAIQDMLSKLDPHSSFIPARHLEAVNEDLQGNFQGIGIEFQIFADTVNVVSVLDGGPSEKAGLLVGDKFLKVGDTTVAGKISSDGIRKLLRGPAGSQVAVQILRKNEKKNFTIQRGTIPLPSLDAGYMITNSTGYIRLSKFAGTTFVEFMKALEALQAKGMQSLVLDLRGNGGGILNEAIEMADEFLSGDKLIVYTEGSHVPRQDFRAKRKGLFESGKLILLLDESSASASEVLAGALQDWDRASIVGRRSFGKGLVQEQYDLSDGSALRLTVARYYTPLGRSIQKPYDQGIEAYDNDLVFRYQHGELVNADSSLKAPHGKEYTTPDGKKVYGGGGITPDYFVSADTAAIGAATAFYRTNVMSNFTYHYYVANMDKLSVYKDAQSFARDFNWSAADWDSFIGAARKDSIPTFGLSTKDKQFLQQRLKALLARYRWRNEGYYSVVNMDDKTVAVALSKIK